MELISDIEHATAVAGSVCAGVEALRGAEFWKIGDKELLTLAETLERVGRLVYAAQVHLAGEVDTRDVAQGASTMVLLRDRLRIPAGDARARVNAARAILPRDLPTGGETPPARAGVAGRGGRRDGRRRADPHRDRDHEGVTREAGPGHPGHGAAGAD